MPTRIAKLMLYYVLLAFGCVVVYAALSGHAQAAETAVTASQGLEGALVDIIQQVSGGVKQGVDFLQAEIPDVVKQLLMWKFAEAVVWAIGSLVLSLQLIPVGIWAVKYHQKYYGDYDVPGHIFASVLSLVVSGIAVGQLFTHALEALKIYIAPKVWLIEYAASLVK